MRFEAGEKGEMEWKSSSLASWLLFLLLLNILDILLTNPAYEANPFTLYFWGQIGIFLSSWIKIGLILFFGVLCVAAKKSAMPNEWIFARKILLGSLVVLVAFYIFVVTWNVILFVSFVRAFKSEVRLLHLSTSTTRKLNFV